MALWIDLKPFSFLSSILSFPGFLKNDYFEWTVDVYSSQCMGCVISDCLPVDTFFCCCWNMVISAYLDEIFFCFFSGCHHSRKPREVWNIKWFVAKVCHAFHFFPVIFLFQCGFAWYFVRSLSSLKLDW